MRGAMQDYLASSGFEGMRTVLLCASLSNGDSKEMVESTRWLAENSTPDRQIYGAAVMLAQQKNFVGGADTALTRQWLEMMHAVELSPETSEMLLNKDQRNLTTDGIAAWVEHTWPESAMLLDGLSPAAVETALPGFIRSAATQDPEHASVLLASQPDSAAATEAAGQLAKGWAEYDVDAARAWASTLTGPRREAAEKVIEPVLREWLLK